MRKYQPQFALYIVLALCTLVSCQKDGPAGPEGPAGPAGQQGQRGAPGTANVIYSDWLDVAFEAITDENTGDTLVFIAEIPAPKLVDSILSKGEVKVYLNASTAANPVIFPLPFNDLYGFTSIQNMNLLFEQGNIFIYATGDGSTGLNQNNEKVYQYRYVLIPGGALAVKPNDLKLDNYKDVQKYLNLKD